MSRVRQRSQLINASGGSLNAFTAPEVIAAFPQSSVTKETKVGLQVHVLFLSKRRRGVEGRQFYAATPTHVGGVCSIKIGSPRKYEQR